MGQAFQMMNGPVLNDQLGRKDNVLAKLAGEAPQEAVDELWWRCLSRGPTPAEAAAALKHLEQAKEKRAALEDISWSLLNSKEFLFRR
jgi:hypothetical protein